MNDQDYHNFYAVIMAGGGGTRLWPLSRQTKPKQMVRLVDPRSLFQIAVDRLEGLFTPERIMVVTVRDQAVELQNICPQIPKENFLIEPFPKGTASVVALAAIVLAHIDSNSTMAILTADHFIENEEKFRNLLKLAFLVSQEGYLVTLGIKPQYPSTGYGYIQRGEILGKYGDLAVYQVIKFKEKPDEIHAKIFIESSDHDWNSGMFIWKTARILDEIKIQMPDLSDLADQISLTLSRSDWNDGLKLFWEKVVPQTIDYGIMEKAKNMAVIPVSDLGWNDVGSWESLFEVVAEDENGNIIQHEDYLGLDTTNSLVYSDQMNKIIVTIGVDDLVIVDVGDALLVCKREESQRVRQIVKDLALRSHLKKYL